ncbi:hypothetical protein ACTMTJ_42270 [Phytohabitans sp. LJ34]|uniref:hypothetical protein n=1 Tax=Phytohabitans sp. LJ34 TaxID=3452217 RepID=UPI003F88BE34
MRRYLDGGAGRRSEVTGAAYESWVRPPARPIRYGLVERWLDRRNGRIDGKKAVLRLVQAEPDASDDRAETANTHPRETPAPPPISTFYVDSLCKRFGSVAEHEKQQRDERLYLLSKKLEAAVAREKTAANKLEVAEAAWKGASQPPTEETLRTRHVAEEELDRPTYLSRQRRLAQHGRTRERSESRYAALDEEWHACNAEVADLRNRISTERRIADSRVRAQLAHTQRRIATYWTHLIRTYERGAELNQNLRPAGPRLPDWTRDDTDGEEQR